MTRNQKIDRIHLMTKEQLCKVYHCTLDQLDNQYKENAEGLDRMYQKAVRTGKKVNGYTASRLEQLRDEFLKSATC
jgi:hypothetical protein